MNYEYEIQNLKEKVANLQQTVIQMGKNTAPFESKAESAASAVETLTPYKETKTAYIGDTSCTFTDIPDGLVSIYLNGMRYYDFGVSNHSITVEFLPREEVTEVTISIQ